VLEDDQIFLHYQERYLEKLGGSANFTKAFYLPTKADLFVFQLRSWVKQYKAEPFKVECLPPPLSKEVLLDRYHSHTKKCASCRPVLNQIQRLRAVVAVTTALIWGVLPLLMLIPNQISIITVVVSSLVMIFGVLIWLGLGKLEQQFYQGGEIPPRNLPEKNQQNFR
jgi:hypothetical protein